MDNKIDVERLIKYLLPYKWQREECEIFSNYYPDYPKSREQYKTVIRYKPKNVYLRHSAGPGQGHFWDVYPDDYINPELAIIALSEAPHPLSY